MKIIVDAFGGDNAPLEIIKGSAEAVQEHGVDILLTGKESTIREVAAQNNISLDHIEIEDCDEVITMHDAADSVIKTKKNSSMAVGVDLGLNYYNSENELSFSLVAKNLGGEIKSLLGMGKLHK